MDSLLERIEENTLDALYLFINETLRDRQTFDIFFENLMSVLPANWSIQRVEVGHEFLSMVERQDDQLRMFETITSLEAIKTLIISDGYVPRKDKGSINTEAFLTSLPRARNLINLDIHRLELNDKTQVDMLADALESMHESLEEIRMTGLFLSSEINNLDPAIEACVDMGHLRSLAMTCLERNSSTTRNNNRPRAIANANNNNANNDGGGGGNNNNNDGGQQQPVQQPVQPRSLPSSSESSSESSSSSQKSIISGDCLLELCQSSSSLQEISLRAMNVDDETCITIAKALTKNLFLTTLDLRQNPAIGNTGCRMILEALERNYDLWCTVLVDNESFQGRFNSLIELNQANRGDLIRNPTMEKLIVFLDKLKNDPTALWYFWTIHDTILYPFISYLKWKNHKEHEIEVRRMNRKLPPSVAAVAMIESTTSSSSSQKRKSNDVEDVLDSSSLPQQQLKLPPPSPMMMINDTTTSTASLAVSVHAVAATTTVATAALPPAAVSPLFLTGDPTTTFMAQEQPSLSPLLYSSANTTTNNNNKRRRMSENLADEVAAILARTDAANASIAAEVEEMDSRAVEEEVQAILAAQRQQSFMY